MSNYSDAELQLSRYIESSSNSYKLLLGNMYFGQALIVMYSTMDALGLLLAPIGQETATGATFRDWAKRCFLPHANTELDVNEFDLWGARCGVLHTFTSEFDSTRNKTARQVQYFSGDSKSPKGKALSAAAKQIDGGKHIMVSIEDIAACFYKSLSTSVQEFVKMCAADPAHEARLAKVLQAIRM
ncbi:hypothetical protein V2I60_19700 [Pseudomonas viridiflava]|uniref:hypothetical protein n=1 Tax=Pseudomonas viridiflava TaxID=33069 RepID=UPI002EBF6509|nr:hypothetical protein [Pseudomonas viridiflava]